MLIVANNFRQGFVYNNGNGFDIYKIKPDNMQVIRLDETNKATLNINNTLTVQKDLEIAGRLFRFL
jgi:hypothetical protein